LLFRIFNGNKYLFDHESDTAFHLGSHEGGIKKKNPSPLFFSPYTAVYADSIFKKCDIIQCN